MGQATVTATADERRSFSALRPLLLLGGFVLVWWFLTTGAAQASGGPDSALADTARSATGTVERVVDRPAPRSAPAGKVRQHRAPVAHVTEAVTQRVDTVVGPDTTPVASVAERTVENTVKPVTTRATDTVRSTVRKVVKDVRSDLGQGTVVLPELHPGEVVAPPVKADESSTRVGETRSNGSRADAFGTASSMLPVAGVATGVTSPATTFDATPDTTGTSGQDTAIPTPPGGGHSGGAFSPADHEGASSVPSGHGGPMASDRDAQALRIAPAATTTSTVTSVDRLPAGPAYPPASSPD